MDHKKHLNHPALYPLWRSLERDWFLQLAVMLVVLVFGFILTAIGMRTNTTIFLLGTILVFIAGYIIFRHFRLPSLLERFQDIIYDEPASIVWIYSIVQEHHPFGLQINDRGIMYFKLADGDEVTAYLPPDKLVLISKVLARALPETVFGYSKERAEQYKKDPARVRREVG